MNRRSIQASMLIAITMMLLGCDRLEDNDLVGTYVLNYRDSQIEVRLDADHSYAETVLQPGSTKTYRGKWNYVEHSGYGGDLNLGNFYAPMIPLGRTSIELEQKAFSMPVQACNNTICLIASDNDPVLHFLKRQK